ncbi:MAG: PilN domain-containing protein [Thiohalorhabdus sp.]|uniref:PilN domain-containing protein n=1 Tax=Thiohalorhabdus sp. TaxID=3094134 RepID=UPI00397EB1A7
MIRINLLPHREQRRKLQLMRDGLGAGIFLLIVLGLLAAAYLHLQKVEKRHQARVEYMEAALADIRNKLDEVDQLKEKRKDLMNKLEQIRKLQHGRDLSVRIFENLGGAVPEDVSLDSVSQTDEGLQLEGAARTNNDVSSFMRRLEASALFTEPDLEVITGGNQDQGSVKSFKMGVKLVDPEDGESDGDEG